PFRSTLLMTTSNVQLLYMLNESKELLFPARRLNTDATAACRQICAELCNCTSIPRTADYTDTRLAETQRCSSDGGDDSAATNPSTGLQRVEWAAVTREAHRLHPFSAAALRSHEQRGWHERLTLANTVLRCSYIQ